MSTPTSDFVKAVTPSMREVAEGVSGIGGEDAKSVAYRYVRVIASQGIEPSAELRRRIALWGWRHVKTLIDLLTVLDPGVAASMAELSAKAIAEAGEAETSTEDEG